MAKFKFKIVNGILWGRMPSGIAKVFNSLFDYVEAYTNEEDEIVDELARLEEERKSIEYPEDYAFLVPGTKEWLAYA